MLRDVDDIAFRIDSHFVVQPTHATYPHGVPHLIELRLVRWSRWLHDQLLEAVFLTMLAGVRTRDSLGTLARDRLRQFESSLTVVG
jgi:hypothetical protein